MFSLFLSIILAPVQTLQKSNRLMDDKTLVNLCKKGERDALEVLFEKYYPEVYRMVLHIVGQREDTDDVVQMAMLEIHRSLPSFRGDSKLSSWVYRVTLNVSNQYLRKKYKQPFETDIAEELLTDRQSSPLSRLESSEQLQKVGEIIRSMPEKKRTAFILAEIEQLSSEEMAEIMDCTVSAVWSRLHQARQMFWARVENSGYFISEKSNR